MAEFACAAMSNVTVPTVDPITHTQAMSEPCAEEWRRGEEQEMTSLNRLHVLSKPERLPKGARKVKTKWIYKRKRDAKGNVVRYRARLVVRGFSQVFGIDYFDVYAPVARLTTLRLVYALSALMSLKIVGMDVDAAFMNAPLEEAVYIDAPEGQPSLPDGYVYKLNKALCGLKQAPRQLNKTVHEF